jgi:hypothetical protein
MLCDIVQWDDAGRGTLPIRVTPKASANRIRIEEREGEKPRVRVDVTVAPEDGKANKQVLKLLAKELGLPKSALSIARGHSSRDKVIVLQKS